MFIRSKTGAVALTFIFLFYSTHSGADNFQCGFDLNNDGDLDEVGELENCLAGSDGNPFCPIGAMDCTSDSIEICPIDESVTCENGQCTTTETASCEYVNSSSNVYVFRCPLTGETFSNSSSEGASRECSSECNAARTQECVQEQSSYTCPLGEQYRCTTTSMSLALPQCTPNQCEDIRITGVVETIEGVDSSMYLDDGERNAEGVCLGETRIFSGRAMSCRLPGVVSVYKNCCSDNNGKVYHDSKGNVVDQTLTNKAIVATAAAAWAAGSAYASALSSGASAGTAAQSGGKAFVNSLQGAFDPTSLAINIAIALVMTWLANACDQESMETATLRASGYCFQVGRVCTNRWLGSCVQQEAVNCCYNSMLARIVNEQGLEQVLGEVPWSNVELDKDNLEALDCGGFTPEQFQALDFQRINFSEYEADINDAITERLITEGDTAIERFKNNEVKP